MIVSFANRGTEDIFDGRNSADARKLLPRELWNTAFRKLDQIDSAGRLEDLKIPPGNRLELLRGDRNGLHSIRINDQYRICFVWTKIGDAEIVEIVDYH
jgi:toxin HigB-1